MSPPRNKSKDRPIMKKRCIVVLLLILILAAIPRFYNLHKQGFLSWDEGMYMNEALFYQSVISHIPEMISGFMRGSIDSEFLIHNLNGWPPSSAKPLHSLLIYLFSIPIGMDVFAAKCMSVVFSLACIVMTFLLIRRYFTSDIAILTALFIALSGYHIYVSRLGVPETNSTFFYLLALYLIERFKKSDTNLPFFVAGLSLGICFAINYRSIIIVPIMYMALLYELMKHRKQNILIHSKRIIYAVMGFAVIPVACHLPYMPLHLLDDFSISFRHIDQNIFTYFDQLCFYLLFQSNAGSYHIHDLYIRFFCDLNGVMMSSLALVGFCILFKNIRMTNIVCILSGLIPFILLSIKSRGNSIRYISIVLPFLSIYSAVAVNYLIGLIRSKRIYARISVGFFVLILCVSTAKSALPFINLNSGYFEAANVLRSQGGEQNLSTNNAYFEFYFGRNIAEQIPDTLEEIESLLDTGIYKFVVIDFMSHRVLRPSAKAFIETNCIPYATVNNPIGSNIYTLMESLGYRHFIADYLRDALKDPYGSKINIYLAEDVLVQLRKRKIQSP